MTRIAIVVLTLLLLVGSAGAENLETKDDEVRRFREAYDEGKRPGRREPHYLRAGVEMVALLGVGAAWYYARPEANKADWDYPSVSARFKNLEWAFDTNRFTVNNVKHPLGGAAYYLFARTNGLSVPVAAAFTVGTSLVWEYLIEVREKLSVNDVVLTPTGGIAIGEFLVHFGDYFGSSPRPNGLHRALAILFGPTHELHRALDGTPAPSTRMGADRLGFSAYYSHRFDVLAEPTWLSNDVDSHGRLTRGRLSAEIVSIPGFLRPGRFALGFSDGDFVDGRLQVGLGGGNRTVDVLVGSSLFGHYRQDVSGDGEQPRGHALLIAFNTAFRYADRSILGRLDRYAMAHIGGPAVKLWALCGAFTLRAEADVHFDFASVRSHAYPVLIARGAAPAPTSSLAEHNYSFAVGGSGAARLLMSLGPLEVGGSIFHGRYGSLDGHNRFDQPVPSATEWVTELEGWVGLVPASLPIEARVFAEHSPRRSKIANDLTVERSDSRYGFGLGGRF